MRETSIKKITEDVLEIFREPVQVKILGIPLAVGGILLIILTSDSAAFPLGVLLGVIIILFAMRLVSRQELVVLNFRERILTHSKVHFGLITPGKPIPLSHWLTVNGTIRVAIKRGGRQIRFCTIWLDGPGGKLDLGVEISPGEGETLF